MAEVTLPRVLVVDDVSGVPGTRRRNFCRQYGLVDVTGDTESLAVINDPLATAVFHSAQVAEGAVVRNDASRLPEVIAKGWPNPSGHFWSMALLDLRFASGRVRLDFPEGQPGDDDFGLKLLEDVFVGFPDIPVIVLSSRERGSVIEACRTLGAVDFIQRDEAHGTAASRKLLGDKLRQFGLIEDERGIISGHSLALLKALAAARRAATGGGNILVLGESGTGKELFARYIHDCSPKSAGPYEVFHAHGTAESLWEDELFGHMKGAYTGAESPRPGVFERAQHGTVFIDEIGDIPEALQNRLLRPLEMREVVRQGGGHPFPLDIQVVLATNKDLDHHAATGRFKSDLLNRIRAYTVTLPPLRDRLDDLRGLVETLLRRLCVSANARWPRTIEPRALDRLAAHHWQDGNVRELRNVLERIVKDNRDSELFIAGDIPDFHPLNDRAREDSATRISPLPAEHAPSSVDDYEQVFGSWSEFELSVFLDSVRLLERAARATLRHRAVPDEPAQVNLAGTVSCLLGRKVSTLQAADFVKRTLNRTGAEVEDSLIDYPRVAELYQLSLKLRPKRRTNRSGARESRSKNNTAKAHQ